MKIRVVTINIAGLQFGWFEGRRDVLINELASLNPDIVFLQEATVVPERRYDQTLDIMNGLGLTSVSFAPYGNREEFLSPKLGGIGIVSRWPFSTVQTRKLPEGTIDTFGARSALLSQIVVGGHTVTLATTHLSYHEEEESLRKKQVSEFVGLVEFYGREKIILGGDFNAVPEGEAMRTLLSQFKDSGETRNTWSGENDFVRSRKDRRLDYLLCSHDVNILDSVIVLDMKKSMFPSDHFGLMVDYQV